jgi:hypothetical protein
VVARSRRSATSKLSSLSNPDRSTHLGPRHSKSPQSVSFSCGGDSRTAGEAACRRGCCECCECCLRRLPLASELWREAEKCGTWTVVRVALTGSPSRRLNLASRARRRLSGELVTAADAAMPCASKPNHGDYIREFEAGKKGLDHPPPRRGVREGPAGARLQPNELDPYHTVCTYLVYASSPCSIARALIVCDRRAAPTKPQVKRLWLVRGGGGAGGGRCCWAKGVRAVILQRGKGVFGWRRRLLQRKPQVRASRRLT